MILVGSGDERCREARDNFVCANMLMLFCGFGFIVAYNYNPCGLRVVCYIFFQQ
jgi:hypothetical protein